MKEANEIFYIHNEGNFDVTQSLKEQ